MKAISTLFLSLWRYSSGRRSYLIGYFSLFILANSLRLLEPYVIGDILNTLQQSLQSPESISIRKILLSFGVIVALTCTFWLLHGPARVLEITTASHTHIKFIDHLFSILISLPIGWHKEQHSGDISSRTRKAARALQDFSSHTFNFIEMSVGLFGSLIALAFISKVAALIALSITLIAFLVVLWFDAYLIKCYDDINERDHFTASAFQDFISNIFTVISLRLEEQVQSEMAKRVSVYKKLVSKTAVLQETKWFLATLMVSLMTVLVLGGYTLSSIAAGVIPLTGTLFMLYEYVQKMGATFYIFAVKYSLTIQQYADIKSVDLIFTQEATPREESVHLPQNWQKLEITDLGFVYKDQQDHIHHLKNISITFKRGLKIALVGRSGSGKSTLLTLIRGLQKPSQANVFCDNILLTKGMQHLTPHVFLIPQDPAIFAGSLKYNIVFDQEASEEELFNVIEMAQFTPTLDRLPMKWETPLAEKGVNLSGGEKQRLALARGLFAARHSYILLLDEPTSAVDSQNELRIYQNIFKAFSHTCIISSIHKLHLLPLFDEIYVLDKGEVVEKGSFYDLLKNTGSFAQLWQVYMESQRGESDSGKIDL